MLWKDFKQIIESQGVTDYTEIVEIRWSKNDDPIVKISAVRIE